MQKSVLVHINHKLMRIKITYLLLFICFSANAQIQQETTTYSYDNLNRLVQVVFNDGSTHNYVYDNLGNRTQLNIETLSIDEETLKDVITVYPNPTENCLNIKLPSDFSTQDVKITIYDVNGRTMESYSTSIENSEVVIDVGKLSNGVYLLHLKSEEKSWSKLFIKK